MARRKKKRRSAPEEATHVAINIVDVAPAAIDPRGATIMRVGWVVFGLGALGVAVERASLIGGIAAAVGFAGVLLAVAGRLVRDRHRRAVDEAVATSWWSLPAGFALVASGFAALLYPAVVSREVFRELVVAYPYGPLVAVALGGSGLALLIDNIDRAAPTEAPFAVPDPSSVWQKLNLVNPLQIPLWVAALGVMIARPLVRLVDAERAARLPSLWRHSALVGYLRESWVEIDREAAAERAARPADAGYDYRPMAVFCLGAVFLSLMEYFGHAHTLRDLLDHYDPIGRIEASDTFWATLRNSPFRRLLDFIWWSGWRFLGFFALPSLTLWLLGQRVADHGLATRGFLSHAWIYLIFFAIVLVSVVGVSYDAHFQTYYPFYSDASRSWYDFWAWEALYAVQFFSLEFFFRGFWLKTGKSMMGSHVIYAMVVPYCMIHFGKPFLETLAAILAGLVLGTLALRTRSIWAGFLIHVSVAITMDLAALMQTTGWPTRWWPDL